MARVGLVAAFLVGFGLLCWRFAARHAQVVSLDVWFQRWELPLWLALVIAFGLGAVLTALLAAYGGVRHRLLERRYRRTLAGLESEIHQLRNLPLAPEAQAHPPVAEEGSRAPRERLRGSA